MIISKDWIQSFSGKMVFPGDLKPEQVTLADIPVALSRRARFSGQTNRMYTVAEHCVRGSELIGGGPEYQMAFLLHEVSEVYLPDIPTPVKRSTVCNGRAWQDLEAHHAEVILAALGLGELLPLLYSPTVKDMDLRMLMTEKRDLLGPSPAPWGVGLHAEPFPERIEPWSTHFASFEFSARYARLRRDLGAMILAIDPGVKMCGAALFNEVDRLLVRAWYAPARVIQEYHAGIKLVIEMPRIYPGSGQQKGDLNDLLNLAAVVGGFEYHAHTEWVRRVFPAQWKGQVPKKIMNARVLSRLSLAEAARIEHAGAKDHNIIDAIGIGLWHLGRL